MRDTRATRALLSLSHRMGGTRIWDLLRGGRVKILMYHGVPGRDRFEGVENFWRYNVPLSEFRQQIEHLARRCNVISLADFRAQRGLSSAQTNVVLTFDDGYGNNFTNAAPVLRELGLPAVFAITTGFVLERQPLWNDVIEFAAAQTKLPRARISWQDEGQEFDLSALAGRVALNNWALRMGVSVDPEERRPFLDTLCSTLEVDASTEAIFANEDYRPMTPEQVRELAQIEGHEIASHSVHHYLTARLGREPMRAELRESKSALEELTGRPCTSLCMPGGSYDQTVLEEASAAGYECVLTSDTGVARSDARTLNRNGVFSRGNLAWFVDEVHGPVGRLAQAASRAKRALRTRKSS